MCYILYIICTIIYKYTYKISPLLPIRPAHLIPLFLGTLAFGELHVS